VTTFPIVIAIFVRRSIKPLGQLALLSMNTDETTSAMRTLYMNASLKLKPSTTPSGLIGLDGASLVWTFGRATSSGHPALHDFSLGVYLSGTFLRSFFPAEMVLWHTPHRQVFSCLQVSHFILTCSSKETGSDEPKAGNCNQQLTVGDHQQTL
jgi:hypothetical protein